MNYDYTLTMNGEMEIFQTKDGKRSRTPVAIIPPPLTNKILNRLRKAASYKEMQNILYTHAKSHYLNYARNMKTFHLHYKEDKPLINGEDYFLAQQSHPQHEKE